MLTGIRLHVLVGGDAIHTCGDGLGFHKKPRNKRGGKGNEKQNKLTGWPWLTSPLLATYRPDFDSPSVFCRLLDKEKGGYFSIAPEDPASCTTKQQYLPSSAILQTRYIHEHGVADVVDFFPRPKKSAVAAPTPAPSWSSAGAAGRRHSAYRRATSTPQELKQWLVRRVACIRGELTLGRLGPVASRRIGRMPT